MDAYTGEDMKEAIEMGVARRISIVAVISPVYIHASLFVWRACVVLFCVARMCCALLSAASARPGSAPPAKRIGKHRASRPSDWDGILEQNTFILEACSLFKKAHV